MKAAIFGASGGIGAALALALAERGYGVMAGSRSGAVPRHGLIVPFTFDLEDAASISAAAGAMAADPPDLVIVATGVLTLPDGTGPERSLRAMDSAAMARMIALNTIGPAMIAKAMLPMMRRDQRTVFAALSARVGSIGDNRLGGWHSYRASKAALNMLLRNFALEMARTHPQVVIAGLHPGTVETDLSAPFRKNLPEGQLTSPAVAAGHLLRVLDGLTPEDSGGVFDWRGARIPE
jgi:NAD(P)-dependent dehydrogenase (short-subunit alcohol dehydrogenase family)